MEKYQNTGYIFYTPMCRELISILNGTMRYNYMTMMKALYLDYSQDLSTTTNIFKKSGYLSRWFVAKGDPFSAHCISDHRISDQKVRTVMVRAIVRVRVRVRVRLGDAVVRNAVGRKVGNRSKVKVSQTREIIDVMSCESNSSAIGSFNYAW